MCIKKGLEYPEYNVQIYIKPYSESCCIFDVWQIKGNDPWLGFFSITKENLETEILKESFKEKIKKELEKFLNVKL